MAISRSTGLVNKLNGLKTNLLSNGTFESNAHDSWTEVACAATSPTGGVTGNALTITNSGAASGSVYQDITTVIGRVYKFSVAFKLGTGAAGGSVEIGTTGSPTSLINGPALTDAGWTTYEYAFIASATTTRITLRNESTVNGETCRFDDALCEEVFDGFIEIMRNCKCNVYTGIKPTYADDAATGTLLTTVSLNETATGLTFTTSSGGTVQKSSTETWKGHIVASGTAGWFRFYESGSDPSTGSNTTDARFDGTVGTTSTDMIVYSTTLTLGLKFEITGFTYTAPRT